MTFISYAQNFEDIMLWRALKHVDKGFYIDVGANDPMIDSVTLAFYERGWRGINIEPMQQYYDQLVAKRPDDTNLQLAVGDTQGTLTFFDIPDTGLSTVDAAIAQMHIAAGRTVLEQQVEVTTLSAICATHAKETIHFLKIDVEGLEGAVIRGMDLRQWRPWILVIEATRPQSQVTSHNEWEDLVLAADYRFAYFDGLNHYYIAGEQAALMDAFKLPPNVFDDFRLRLGHSYSYPPDEFVARTQEAETRAHQANVHAHEAELRAQHAEAGMLEAQAQTRQAEEFKRQAEVLTRRAEEQARHAQAEAHNAARHLEELHMSASWRITQPLRAVKSMMKKALGKS